MTKSFSALAALAAVLALGGCVAVPVYEPPPVAGYYYAPAPAYYGPSLSIGIHGGRGHGHRGHRRGGRHHRH